MEEQVEMIRKLTDFKFTEKDILVDLLYTKSVEQTLNRIFDGQFLKNTSLDISKSDDDSDSDGIEIIGVQQSQKSVAIELLSSPVCSRPNSPIWCSSPVVVTTTSKPVLYPRLERSENLEAIQIDHKISPMPAFLESSSDDEFFSIIPCSAPAILEKQLSSTDEEFDMSFMRKRGPISANILPKPKTAPNVSKKALKPSADNSAESGMKRKVEKQRKAEDKQRMLQEREVAQAVKSANVLRQKITAAEEIIVSICSEWIQLPSSKAIAESITQSGARLVSSNHKLPFTLSFSRKVNRDYDFFGSGVWKPCLERIEVEPYTLLYFPATKLAGIIKEKNGLVNNLSKTMNAYPGHTYIYLIEDLVEYYKKRKRLESKYENDCLKVAMGDKPVKRKEDILALLKDMPEQKEFENSLALLQNFGKGKCKIQFSPASETAGWIVSFLQQIAIFPEMQYFYSLTVSVHSSLNVQCADVKSGKDPKDTWIKMLQEITSVTNRVAEAIAKIYPTCNSLISAFLNMPLDDARKLLIGIPVEPGIVGGAKKSIGAVQAKKVAEVLLGIELG